MAKAERAEREKWFGDFVELSPDATIVVNASGIISLVNGQAEELFGYPREEMVGQPVEMLVPEKTRAGHSALRDCSRIARLLAAQRLGQVRSCVQPVNAVLRTAGLDGFL